MKPVPSHLQGHARTLWKKHFARLVNAGVIEETDADGFAEVCEVYRHLRAAKPDSGDPKERIWYIGLLKQWQTLSKQYGLLPRDRKRSGIEPEADLEQVLGKKMERR